MNEITTGPELEACGWYVRTKRTDVDAAGLLVADCSIHPYGAEYARLFAAAIEMREALQIVERELGKGFTPMLHLPRIRAVLAKAAPAA